MLLVIDGGTGRNALSKVRIFELIEFDDAVKGALLAELDRVAREELGDDIDIIVHCHNELDLPSAVKVAELLAVQLRSQVGWVGVVEELVRQNLAPMIEIGPGQMLGRSVRWIHRQAQVQYTETAAALEDAVKRLKNAH